MVLGERAQLALDAILGRPTDGIPTWIFHPMEHKYIERVAGTEPGSYVARPEEVYLACQHAAGVCMIDQFIPTNPLSMGSSGYESGTERGATTGAEQIIHDGVVIDSPEAAVEHMEKFVIPGWRKNIAEFDADARVKQIIDGEREIQRQFGPDILKTPYCVVGFPAMYYYTYGHANYLMAYALYPDVIERCFAVQADWAVLNNRAVVRAYAEGNLPPFTRLDHDIADSRGTMVSMESLEKMWFPHFSRAIEPVLHSNIKMIWHCDGNLMAMVPRLLDCGLVGFQGFQYEDGMDYEKICRMKTRDGDDLLIIAGVSVTTTLPRGKPDDVKREMRWLVENGPKTGLFLGQSSSMAPGVPWENIKTFVDGLHYYRTHGRAGL